MIKKLIGLLLISFGCTLTIQAQEANIPDDKDSIRTVVEVSPKADYDWNRYLANNLRYPKQAREDGIQGKVYVCFVVERDGSISNVRAIKGGDIGGGLPEEAVRVVKSMPKWKPGSIRGELVRTYFTVPLNFRLQTDPDEIFIPTQVESEPTPMFNIPLYLAKHLRYPKKAIKQQQEGMVYVLAVINEKGELIHPEVYHKDAADPELKALEEEALRLVKAMPAWMPAKIRNIPVKCYVMIPVLFILPKK